MIQEFKALRLFDKAMTHKSVSRTYNNEVLEFLGDSALSLITSDYLLSTYPSFTEGEATKRKACLVSNENLAKIAIKLGIKGSLKVKKGTVKTKRVLASSLEALIGAIFTEKGYDAAKAFMIEHLKESKNIEDYKTDVQEISQKQFGIEPFYKTEYDAHISMFYSQIHINNKPLGEGFGKSKKIAEKAAAKEALTKLNDERF